MLAGKEFSIAGTFTGQVDVGELGEMRVKGWWVKVMEYFAHPFE
mgnify:CR=1 FL=1